MSDKLRTDDFVRDEAIPIFYAGERLAYIRTIGADEARATGAIPPGIQLPEGIKLYVLNAADGTRMAVTDNWDAAYGAAVQNEFVPLSVH